MKICSKCKIEKEDFISSQCKDCNKKYRLLHKENIKKKNAEYYLLNKSILDQKNKDYQSDNKEELIKYRKQYRVNNKQYYNEYNKKYRKNKYANDVNFKLKIIASASIYQSLKNSSSCKNKNSVSKYLTYTMRELKGHLEKQFEPWMTWQNHGKYNPKAWDDNDSSTWTWQIDHIISQSILPYISMEDDNFKKCWALSNLRPYSAKQNIIDGNRMVRLND